MSKTKDHPFFKRYKVTASITDEEIEKLLLLDVTYNTLKNEKHQCELLKQPFTKLKELQAVKKEIDDIMNAVKAKHLKSRKTDIKANRKVRRTV